MDENEVLEPIATEAGQDRIAQAIANFGSLENALRAERAANTAVEKANESMRWAVNSTVVESGNQSNGGEDLYSAKHYAEQARDAAQNVTLNLDVDETPTENSDNLISSGAVYEAINSLQLDIDDLEDSMGNVQANVDVFTLKTHAAYPTIQDDGTYYVATADATLCEWLEDDGEGNQTVVRWIKKTNNVPAICGIIKIDVPYYNSQGNWTESKDLFLPMLIYPKLAKDGGSMYDDQGNTYCETGSEGRISTTITVSGHTFVCVCPYLNLNINYSYRSNFPLVNNGTVYQDSNVTYNNELPLRDGANALINEAQPILVDDIVEQELFQPQIYSSYYLSNKGFKALVKSGRPIAFSLPYSQDRQQMTRIYYYLRQSGSTYYYENNFGTIGFNLEYETYTFTPNTQEAITVDATPTQGSTNPVSSGGVYNALENLAPSGSGNTITVDNAPTQNSPNPVSSGGVYTAIENAVQNFSVTVDNSIIQGSNNPVSSGAVYTGLLTKQDLMTLDQIPTPNSSNAITSGAVYSALSSMQNGGTPIVIDTTITENSQNPVSSSAIYAELAKRDPDIFTLKTHASNLTLQDDGTYYVATANKVVGEWLYYWTSGGTTTLEVSSQIVKCNDIPALCGTASIKRGSGYASGTIVAPILISLIPDGVNWNKVNGSGNIENRNQGYMSYYDDTQRGVRWYYSTVWWYDSSNNPFRSDYPRVGSRTYDTVSEAVQAILDVANPILIETLINEDLFNPSVSVPYSYSGDPVIISNATVRGLIKGCRPFKYYDGNYTETCYYVKQVYNSYHSTYNTSYGSSITANVYHYESQSYKFQIKDVTWEMTVTPKTSSGLTAGDGIDITNDTISVDVASANTIGGIKVGSGLSIDANGVLSASGGSGSGDVTTNTDQNITGTKTFVGSKKVAFKQSAANDKLGFTLFGNTGTERGYLEFNPTNTTDGITGLMALGNYATSAAGLTQVGFRRYSNISGASGAYNLLMPMVADAKTPFNLTTTYQNFYLPLGFTDGTTTVKAAKSGLVDLSPLLASLEARIAALEGN